MMYAEGDELVYNGDSNGCFVSGRTYKVIRERNTDFLFVQCDNTTGYLHVKSRGCVHSVANREMQQFSRFIQKSEGWIGVDLDGTLAVYDGWRGPYHIGHPIKPMVQRILRWLGEGRDVRIFTARMTDLPRNEDGTPHDLVKVRASIDDWCRTVLGRTLPVTNVKDWHMTELWDDRAVQVRPNTGVTLADELEAIRSAEAGKAATP